MEALVVVQHDLGQAAAKHPTDVKAFLSWVRENGLTMKRGKIRKKIEEFHSDVTDSLRLYIGFVLRFRVYLKYIRHEGVLKFEPDYEGTRHSQLKVGVRGGTLVAPTAEPDADFRDLFASSGGTPAKIRSGVKSKGSRILMSKQSREDDSELMGRGLSEEEVDHLREVQRRRGINPEDEKLRFVEVDSDDTSSLTQLLDQAYDPPSITFLLVRSRGQTRLVCVVGELVSDDEWNQLGVVRPVMQKVMWKRAPAGAPVDFPQFAQDIKRIPPNGKISRNSVIDASDQKTSETDLKRTEKRLQRAKDRADRVRRQMTF